MRDEAEHELLNSYAKFQDQGDQPLFEFEAKRVVDVTNLFSYQRKLTSSKNSIKKLATNFLYLDNLMLLKIFFVRLTVNERRCPIL